MKRTVPFVLYFFIVLQAFVIGFRMPSLWTLNYYLPSMFDGFYRRSMAGTLLTFLGDAKFNYAVIAGIEFFVLALLLIVALIVFKKNTLTMLIVTAFMVSANGPFLFHEVGYIEQLLFVILVAAIVLYRNHKVLSITLFSTSILFHELALFTTVPLYFLSIYLETDKPKQALWGILPSLSIFAMIYFFFQTVPVEEIKSFMHTIEQKANYPYRYDYYEIFVNKFIGNRFTNHFNLNSVIPLVLLGIVTVATALVAYEIRPNKTTTSLIVSSAVLPLLLGFFGYDLNRWFFLSYLSLTVAFLLFLIRYNMTLRAFCTLKRSVVYCIALIIFIGTMPIDYFEHMALRNFNIQSMIEIYQSFGTIPPL